MNKYTSKKYRDVIVPGKKILRGAPQHRTGFVICVICVINVIEVTNVINVYAKLRKCT